MQSKKTLINKVILSALLFTTIISFSNCKKSETELLTPANNETYDINAFEALPTTKGVILNISSTLFKSDGGFGYKLQEAIDGGDTQSVPTQSILKLYENGIELGPAHSTHDDIRNLGKGRYSHWGTTIIFSASDNSNPKTNGKKYTYTIGGVTGTVTPSDGGAILTALTLDANNGKIDAGYALRIPMDPNLISDSGSQPTASTVKVYENGVEIGPAHSVHDDIRNIGKGRFSHWSGYLYFSASDNSNPKTNGRKYTYTVGGQATTTPITNPVNPVNPPTTTTTAASGLVGYAMVDGATTGGAGGETVTVSTLSALKSAAGSSSPMIIKVSGTITGTGNIVVRSNKTIIGINGATLNGVGLRIFGNSYTDNVRNIIVQNLKIKYVIQVDPATGGSDNDCIGLKYANHVWIDHCELVADVTHSDWEYYDGLLDINKQSDCVTVSWTKFSNSFKATLVGGVSDAGLGKLRVTYHHNFFDNIGERAPSFSFGTGHIFNNYFLKSATASGYSVGARDGATLLVENNYFENVSNSIRTDIDSANPGRVSGVSTNIIKNSGAPKINTSDPNFKPNYEYRAVLTPASEVAAVVSAGAGATL